MSWDKDQEFERAWWGNCANTFTEEIKQLSYSYKMGLTAYANAGQWPVYNLEGRSVLDIGGGPVSLLLKCENRGRSTVIDPCPYPYWVRSRYSEAEINYIRVPAEEFRTDEEWDEVWIYNVLQHVMDPERVIQVAQLKAPVIRIFEWIDLAPHEGHPHELKEEELNKWLGGTGTTEWLDENQCYGRAYYGVFNY